jgi:hypothetical protein
MTQPPQQHGAPQQQVGVPQQYGPPEQHGGAGQYDATSQQYGQPPQYGQPGQYGQPSQYGPPQPYGVAGPPGAADQPGGAWPPPPRRGTNGFAIAALVCGLIAAVPFAIAFGIVALVQIRKRNQGGRGLAIAGLVLAVVWTLVLAAVITVAVLASADRDESGRISDGGSVSSFELSPGDCLNGLRESQNISSLPAVPCAEPHEGEVFALFDISGSAWPGDAEVAKQAERGCVTRLEQYAPTAADDSSLEIFFLHPTQRSWASGDREVACVAMDPNKKRTGSLRD